MDNLANCLRYYVADRLSNDPGWRNITVSVTLMQSEMLPAISYCVRHFIEETADRLIKNNKERTMLKWIVFLLCCCWFQLLAVNMLHSGCMLICTVFTVTNLKPSSRSSCLMPVFPVKVNTRLWTSSGDREVQLPGTDFNDWCMPVELHINTYTGQDTWVIKQTI